MLVTVKLFAQYREGRFKVEERAYHEGISAQGIIDELGVAKELPLGVLMVNGRHESQSYLFKRRRYHLPLPKSGRRLMLF